eukprot:5984450-Amphidinium_carterae.1
MHDLIRWVELHPQPQVTKVKHPCYKEQVLALLRCLLSLTIGKSAQTLAHRGASIAFRSVTSALFWRIARRVLESYFAQALQVCHAAYSWRGGSNLIDSIQSVPVGCHTWS